MTFLGVQLVAGEASARGAETFAAVDPRTGEDLPGLFHEATDEELDRALEAAASAHRRMAAASGETLAALLAAAAEEIEALGAELVERATAETALPAARIEAERGRTCAQLRLFSGLARSGLHLGLRRDGALPTRTPAPRPELRRRLVGVGPVVVFGASNFPLAFSVAGGDTASAWAAGCPVVVKGHPLHPGTGELVGRALGRAVERSGLPGGAFSLLQGRSHALGRGLVSHPATRAVGFTGSLGGGRALLEAAAARPDPIPVFAEMGSVNPVFVLPGALATRGAEIAAGLAASATLGVGQFCTQPGLIFVLGGAEAGAFRERLGQGFAAAPPGVMLSRGIAEAWRAGLRVLEERGARRIAGEAGDPGPGGCDAAPALHAAAADLFAAEPRLREEVFGPSSLLVEARDEAGLLECAELLEGQLTATLHRAPADRDLARRLLAVLEHRAGRIVFDGFPTGVEVSPSMQHGGPWPASSDARGTSVGTAAVDRFLRPVCWQDAPEDLLPEVLKDETGPWDLVDGEPGRG